MLLIQKVKSIWYMTIHVQSMSNILLKKKMWIETDITLIKDEVE